MKFYISVLFLGLPDDIHEEKPSFLQFKKNALPTDGPTDGRTDRRTDRPTDRRTDRPGYRDARIGKIGKIPSKTKKHKKRNEKRWRNE